MRKYYITDYGLKQVEITPPTHPSLYDRILAVLADFPEGMTAPELADYLNYEIESPETGQTFLRTLNNLMNVEYVVYEDERIHNPNTPS